MKNVPNTKFVNSSTVNIIKITVHLIYRVTHKEWDFNDPNLIENINLKV